MNLLRSIQLDLVDSRNMSCKSIQFIIVLVGLYYVKKRLDLHFAKKHKDYSLQSQTCGRQMIDPDEREVVFVPDDEFFIPEEDGFEIVFEPDEEFAEKLNEDNK